MASSSNGVTANPFFGQVVTEKLMKTNFLLWKAQILPAVRGARMEGYLTGATAAPAKLIDAKDGDKIVKKDNPAYDEWVVADQQLLGFLLSTVSKEVLTQVVNMHTAAQVW